MSITRRRALGLTASLAVGAIESTRAQELWPTRSLRILVGTAAGGSPDIVSRLIAEKMSDRLGQSVYVENNPTGAGAVAFGTVTRSPPDGTNLTMLTAGYASGVAVNKFNYEGDRTYGFVSMVCAYPMVLSVAANSPIKSFPDLLERARSAPGKLTCVTTSLGSVNHLVGKWIDMAAGTDMVPVPYRGTSAAVTDVLSGRVDVMLDTATASFPRIRTGQFRVLAVTSAERYPLMPEAPTVAETLPDVRYMSWLGLAAAPNTPRPIIDRLNNELRTTLSLDDVTKKLAEGGNVATPTTPDDMRKHIDTEVELWRKIVAINNIKVD